MTNTKDTVDEHSCRTAAQKSFGTEMKMAATIGTKNKMADVELRKLKHKELRLTTRINNSHAHQQQHSTISDQKTKRLTDARARLISVSYTHLTLPTIYSV